ncbi:hypothetical protein CLOACE_21340 [Clostridium acetireducens DSM 10703]|uniref:Uncharacterized protein n=1 Tax=Clostridium acetireducens DSM 10703 TaxID=1121290 RepID=A0A1E8EWU9_9CLOT|nr:hypothetical protein CLOACE_21340 [Clostridium acetireducens DSM 10703]
MEDSFPGGRNFKFVIISLNKLCIISGKNYLLNFK